MVETDDAHDWNEVAEGDEDSRRDDADSEGDDSDNEHQSKSKPGPIDKDTRDALDLKEEYEEKMVALAQEKSVSLHSLYRLVGEDTVKHRDVSAWNAFQKYQAAHNPTGEAGKYQLCIHEYELIQL